MLNRHHGTYVVVIVAAATVVVVEVEVVVVVVVVEVVLLLLVVVVAVAVVEAVVVSASVGVMAVAATVVVRHIYEHLLSASTWRYFWNARKTFPITSGICRLGLVSSYKTESHRSRSLCTVERSQ